MNSRLLAASALASLFGFASLPAAPPSPGQEIRLARRDALAVRTAPPLAEAASDPVLNATSLYAFSTGTTGSLTDMGSGTTLLIRGGQVDLTSPITLIGFDFYFQGTRQDRFSVNAHGVLRFGATAMDPTVYDPLRTSGSYITAYANLQRTRNGNGKVHCKVLGTAPSRTLVVEWLNIQSHFDPSPLPANATYQIRLSETTGVIEFVYGAMSISEAGSNTLACHSPQIGFSTGSTNNTWASVRVPRSGSPAPTVQTTGTPTQNVYDSAGDIPALGSSADGARRFFRFTPLTPAAPSAAASPFTAVGLTGMTLNWVNNSTTHLANVVYQSTDGVNFTFVASVAATVATYTATDLSAGTTYYWRIAAVSEGALSNALTGSQATASAAVVTSTATGGAWSAAATWQGGAVPASNQAVAIATGATVTIDTTVSAYSVNVASGGTLQFAQAAAQTLTVTRNVTIESGGTLQSNPAGTITAHVLSVGGTLTNDGTLDLSTNGNAAGANLTFTGNLPATLGGSGAVTDLRTLTVAKSAQGNVLELRPTNFTVQGATAAGSWLTLTSGTLRLGGSFAGTSPVFAAAAYTIGANAGFWLDNPNYTVTGQAGNATLTGLLRVSRGTFGHGTAATHVFGTSGTPTFLIEGGTLNFAGRLAPANGATYNQSGGTVNVATVGNSATSASFDAGSTVNFNQTGGSIVLVQANSNANGFDFRLQGFTLQGNGGQVQTGSAATVGSAAFRLRTLAPNVTVFAGATARLTAAAGVTDLLVRGSIVVQAGATLDLGGLTLFLCGNLTNHGTLKGDTERDSGGGNFLPSRLVFWDEDGQGAATYAGSGTVTAPLLSFEVDNVDGVTIAPTVNQIVALTAVLTNGQLTGAGKLTLGNGGATQATFEVATAPPAIDARPTYNPGTGGTRLNYLAPFITGLEVPVSRSVTRLDISNSGGVTLAGGDLTVTGDFYPLLLGFSVLTTGANTLIVASPGAPFLGDSGWVHGALRKTIPAAGVTTFQVGTATESSSVDVNVTGGALPATLTVRCSTGRAPWLHSSLTGLVDRWWDVQGTGPTADLIFNYYLAAYQNLRFLRQVGPQLSALTPSVAPTDFQARANGLGTFAGGWALVDARAASIASADSSVFHLGRSNSFSVLAIGVPPPTLALTGALPSGVSFNPATGVLGGVPAAGTAGSYPLAFEAGNGGTPASQNFTLVVNTPPLAGADVLGTRAGQPVQVPAARLLLNDSDPDGDAIGLTAVGAASAMGGAVALAGGVVTYTPPAAFVGSDSFSYTLTDARGGSTIGTVAVSVSALSANVAGLTLVDGVPTLTAYGIVGRVYRLEFANDMTGTWTPLGSPQTAGGDGSFVLTDPTPPPLPPQRFYRVVENP